MRFRDGFERVLVLDSPTHRRVLIGEPGLGGKVYLPPAAPLPPWTPRLLDGPFKRDPPRLPGPLNGTPRQFRRTERKTTAPGLRVSLTCGSDFHSEGVA